MRKSVWHYFFRSKVCTTLAILYFVIPCFFIAFLASQGMTGFLLLHTVCRFNFYICLFLVCISYYYLSSAFRNNVKEVSEINGRRNVFENSGLGFLLLFVCLWTAAMCVVLALSSFSQDGSAYFLTWFPKNYLWNIFVPQLICLLLTYIVASGWNSNKWIFFEFAFLFMISPFTEKIVWTQKPSVRIDMVWNKLRWIFEILYQNGEWSPDYQNNMQLENVRICVELFWLILIAAVILYRAERRKIGTAVLALAIIVLAASYRPASLYRLDSRWDGINKDINSYAQKEWNGSDPDFDITDYDLHLSFGDMLSVSGTMLLKSDTAQNQFVFTLYNGYRLKRLESESKGISVSWTRTKDYVAVKTDKNVKQLRLSLEYSGYNNKFYANRQAALLPGWFPWYPMAGKRQIILGYSEYGNMYGYNPYNRIDSAHICLDSDKEIITNLEQKENGSFEGISDSITVLSGNIQRTKDKDVLTCFPLSFVKNEGETEFVAEEKTEFQKMLKQMQALGVDTDALQGKKVLLASKDMGRNLVNDDFAVFDDYILASPEGIGLNNALHSILLGDRQGQDRRVHSPLLQMITETNFEEPAQDIVDEWINELEDRKENPDSYDNQIEDQDELLRLLKGADSLKVVRTALQYDMNPSMYRDDRAFIKSIGAEK